MTNLLGNDVVDMGSPHARGKSSQPRFVKKVLTKSENASLNDFPDPDSALWLYWAAKESAYKALARHNPNVSSSPQKYSVFWGNSQMAQKRHGCVQTPLGNLPVTGWIDEERVCCLCCQFTFSAVLGLGHAELSSGTIPDYTRTTEEQSHLVRESAIGSLSTFFDCSPSSITIGKPAGKHGLPAPPRIWINGKQTDILLSLSHDGRFVFYAWGLEYSGEKAENHRGTNGQKF